MKRKDANPRVFEFNVIELSFSMYSDAMLSEEMNGIFNVILDALNVKIYLYIKLLFAF